ncbi:MAG: undecaprenyl-diphosphate phosphatase [Nitrococcus sp.]|nr:undecaprenyl-diphosphate phosphatase [Nitrococcus sp.]
MDIATLFIALLLGLLEGLTEFLPISSTGHLIIAGDLLGFTGARAASFKIVIQLGAILAICWFYRHKLTDVVRGLPGDPSARRFLLNLVVAFIPAAVLGLLFHDVIKQFLFSPVVVATALIVGGVVILLIERQVHRVRVETVDETGWRDALKIGIAQTAALIPGVSRSGATIMGGLVGGLSRRAATEFSFFLAIPVMFAATAFDLFQSWDILRPDDLLVFLTGFVAAFASAFVAVRFLLQYISNHDFTVFAWYRIVLGALALWYYMS